MFRRTTAINKILAMTTRKKVIQGGTWAGFKPPLATEGER